MIVEFIGPSSSGKSTIIEGIRSSWDVNFSTFSVLSIGGNYYYDLVALPWFMKFAVQNREICKLARRSIIESDSSICGGLNLYRNFAKKMGMYEFVRAMRRNDDILWDEGSVHAAHNLFVHAKAPPSFSDIEEFANYVPLPDLLVYVKVPLDDIIFRMRSRGGHRRVRKNEKGMKIFAEHALQVFENLIGIDRIKKRTVVVENSGNDKQDAIDMALEEIVRIKQRTIKQ